jgi:hypothetical protein
MAFAILRWLLYKYCNKDNTYANDLKIIVLFHSNGEFFFLKKHVLHGQKHIFSNFFLKKKLIAQSNEILPQ